MKIATWNVNSVRARITNVLDWLQSASPDILLLQELKVTEEAFPRQPIEELGYNLVVHGQKSYNGVAILSRQPMADLQIGLPGDDDDTQARYLEAEISGVRVASIYLPNGNPVDSEKFDYKLAWMRRLIRHTQTLLASGSTFVLGGDYNIIPQDEDCHNPAGFADDALARPESRQLYRQLVYLGLTDAFRAIHPHRIAYSYWDYQAGAWQKDNGLRIDHLLLSPQAADRLNDAEIDKSPRGKTRPSDHTPVLCWLED